MIDHEALPRKGDPSRWHGDPKNQIRPVNIQRDPSYARAAYAVADLLGERHYSLTEAILTGVKRKQIPANVGTALLKIALPDGQRVPSLQLPMIDSAAAAVEADRRCWAALNSGDLTINEVLKMQRAIRQAYSMCRAEAVETTRSAQAEPGKQFSRVKVRRGR